MIIRQYEAVIRGTKTETRRTSEKDTYKVGHVYSVVPKRAKTTVWYRWTWKELQIYHETMYFHIPGDQGIDRPENNWKPLRICILSKHWEPLHAITEESAIAEGITGSIISGEDEALWFSYDGCNDLFPSAVDAYHHLWDSINGESKEFCWDANPQVCVHNFELVTS